MRHGLRLVVAGATGRIGGMLWRQWRDAPPPGFAVTWTGRRVSGPVTPDTLACRLEAPARFAAIVAGADLVLDLAGPTGAKGSDAQTAHAALFDALAAVATGPVLTMSSAAVYGPGANLSEDAIPAPASAYARAKLEVERKVRATPGAAALRLANVAGADALLGPWQAGTTLRLDRFPDGRTPVRSYLGPASLAAILAALCPLAAAGRLPAVLNLCGPAPVEMAALLDRAGIGWTPVPAPAAAVPEVSLSAARLGALIDLPADAGSADRVISEWQDWRG